MKEGYLFKRSMALSCEEYPQNDVVFAEYRDGDLIIEIRVYDDEDRYVGATEGTVRIDDLVEWLYKGGHFDKIIETY